MFLSTVFTLFCLMASVPSSCGVHMPSAHVEGSQSRYLWFPEDTAISAWNRHHENSHEEGIAFSGSQFRVPSSGRYYVYTQLYFSSHNRFKKNRVAVYSRRDNEYRRLLMIHKPMHPNTEETAYVGGIFRLNEGDKVLVKPLYGYGSVKLWVGPYHSYFGMNKLD